MHEAEIRTDRVTEFFEERDIFRDGHHLLVILSETELAGFETLRLVSEHLIDQTALSSLRPVVEGARAAP